jgi:hypothetical protein
MQNSRRERAAASWNGPGSALAVLAGREVRLRAATAEPDPFDLAAARSRHVLRRTWFCAMATAVFVTSMAHADPAPEAATTTATTTTTTTTTATATATATTTATAPEAAPSPALRRVLRSSKALVAGGGSLFATLYLASALAAADGYDSPDGTSNPRGSLWIPAAGPFIMLGHTTSALADVFLVLDGLGQLGGLTMFVYGIATPKAILVPADTTTTKVDVVPLVGAGISGAALVGRF